MNSLRPDTERDLSLIVELQQTVATASLELIPLMELVCQQTQALTRATGAVIELAEGEDMVYQACSGTLAAQKGLRLKQASSLSGRCIQSGEVLSCEDSETDGRVDRAACRKVGARSMIVVPLIHQTRTIGVLKVVSTEAHFFSERDVNVLRLISGLLGARIDHASEFSEKMRAIANLQATEVRIRESESRALAATEAKSAFLANMSHEIRTPLTGILGMSELLRGTRLNKEQNQFVQIIQISADALLSLVNDILDLSKIEANRMTLESLPFSPQQLIEEVEKILSHAAQAKRLDFKRSIDSQVPAWLVGDPARIRQILINLVNNAVKFTERGSVTLSAQHLGSTPEGERLRIAIQDTGIGIPRDSLSMMFQPFSQLDSSTSRRFGGSGLGLSICRQLVELMGGRIGVESQVGRGSEFWFELTLPKATGPAVRVATESAPLPSIRVLVVEDNLVNQMITSRMLENLGHRPLLVASGSEALEALNREEIEMVLMDCQMPGMDGYETTQKIRESPSKWSRIPVLAITANAAIEDRDRCLQSGMTDYLAKPFTQDDLREAVSRAWRQRG